MKPHPNGQQAGRSDWRIGLPDRASGPMPAQDDVVTCEYDDACIPIHCSECLKRIPADEIASRETEDYVRHFCGLTCLRRWEARRAQFIQE